MATKFNVEHSALNNIWKQFDPLIEVYLEDKATNLIGLLERRLDAVVYRLKFANIIICEY